MRYVVRLGGGMGDAILRYARSGLAALRVERPKAFVRLAVMCVGPHIPTLFEYCPLIDELVSQTWDGSGRDFDGRWVEGMAEVPQKGPTTQIYLAPGEQALSGYVAVHPFAGTGDRDWRGKIDIEALVRSLTTAGKQVVLLGGDSTRTDGWGKPGTVELTESSALEMPGLLNLVGRASVREQAYAAMNASAFVGTFSSFHSAAIAGDVPKFVVTDRAYQKNMEGRDPQRGIVAENSRVTYFDEFDADRFIAEVL